MIIGKVSIYEHDDYNIYEIMRLEKIDDMEWSCIKSFKAQPAIEEFMDWGTMIVERFHWIGSPERGTWDYKHNIYEDDWDAEIQN